MVKSTYKAVVHVTLESDTENELDLEIVYEKMRRAVRDMPPQSKRAKLTSFRLLAEFDVEGKQIFRNGEDCDNCPQIEL